MKVKGAQIGAWGLPSIAPYAGWFFLSLSKSVIFPTLAIVTQHYYQWISSNTFQPVILFSCFCTSIVFCLG